jgi:L-alanine-DL-glutamate epimerase-like enolase superfamily enzyme
LELNINSPGARSGTKIESIETIALPEHTLVRVKTADGIEGIGQAESPSLVIDACIKTRGGLEDLLKGEDPTEVERLWQKMYNGTSLWGRRGVTIAAIGAVETALWDITGKISNKPVCELIWQSFAAIGMEAEIKKQVRPYTTAYPPGTSDAEIRERMDIAMKRGFRAIKFEEFTGGFGHGTLKDDVRLLTLVREIIGPDRDLMVDVQNAWTDVGQAIATCKAIEPLNVFFVEAPFAPDNLESYRRLADAVDVRIAAGDWGYTTRFDYFDLMQRAGVDVVQPSTVRSGGISEIIKIAEEAYRRGRLCITHSWNHMVGVAAAVHIAAVLPNMPYFEFPTAFPDSPVVSDLLVPVLKPNSEGLIEVPGRPGLGFTLNEDVVNKYRRQPS